MTIFHYSIKALLVYSFLLPLCMHIQFKTENFVHALLLKIYGIKTRVIVNGSKNGMYKIFGINVKTSKKAPDMLIIVDNNKHKQYAFAKVRMFYNLLTLLLFSALVCIPAKLWGNENVLLQAYIICIIVALFALIISATEKDGCINTYFRIKKTFIH